MAYGQTLLEKLQAEKEAIQKRHAQQEDDYAFGDKDPSDCFLTDWARAYCAREIDRKINILENKGKEYCEVLCDLEGNVLSNRLIETRYGYAFNFNGQWVNVKLKPQTLEKRGFQIKKKRLPVWISKSGNRFVSDVNYWTGKEVK